MKKFWNIVLFSAVILFFASAGSVNRSLAQTRQSNRIESVGELKDAPPIMVFTTVVLGGFRGLIADVLWLRLSQLQDEGKFYELVQLSDWITKLEPRRGKVWTHHAWNMAYNVSILMPDKEERWRWVKNGIELLRDEGLVYNPGDKWIYFNLGWFFQHKIGQESDDMHLYYKKRWAMEMYGLFGGTRLNFDKLKSEPARLKRMKDEYKLFPSVMLELEEKYGPLNWTRPETHSLYWAYMGKKKIGLEKERWLDMMIRQSLRELGKEKETEDNQPERGINVL